MTKTIKDNDDGARVREVGAGDHRHDENSRTQHPHQSVPFTRRRPNGADA